MSHTATGEWQSFELRMRRRRAERLVLRADVAADAGCFEDAQAALAEARTLWPGAPGIAEVQYKIDADNVIPPHDVILADPPAPVQTGVLSPDPALFLDLTAPLDPNPAPASVPSRWKEVTAAAAALVFVCAAVAVLATTTLHSRLSARDAKSIADVIEAATPYVPMDRSAQTPATDTVLPSDTLPQVAAPRPIDTTPPTAAPLRTEAKPQPPVREPVHALAPVPIDEPSRVAAPAVADAVQPESTAPMPATLSAPAAPPPAVSPPGIVATTGISMPAAPSASVQPPQEVLVRSALARYAKAYTDLDVDAAERVWPSVNRSALERAFGSLDSQRVSLGDCRIQVDVATAHASCSGTATWRPKVGGRERTDARRWDFDLVEKSNNGWQITNARVQNR